MSGKLPFGLKAAKPGSLKVKSFSIGSLKKKKKSKFQLMKEERERKKREAEAEAAAVYEDFAKHFDSAATSTSSAAGASKTFVLGAGVGAHTVAADSASKSPRADSATAPNSTRRKPVSDGVKSMFSAAGGSRRTGSSSGGSSSRGRGNNTGSRATHAAFSTMQPSSSSSSSSSSFTTTSLSTARSTSPPSASSSSSTSKPPSELSSLLDEIKQTRSTRKSARNIDSFLEELKSGRPSDDPAAQAQGGRGGAVTGYGGSHYDGDPLTTNLYVGNLAPTVTEEVLIEQFGDMGEIASVKIMWPRTPEEKARQRNCGFVSYMKRDDAAFAQREMDGAMVRRRVRIVFADVFATHHT